MSIAYDYTNPVTVTITNVIKPECYKACDAGTPVQRVVVAYDSIKDKCAKFDYLFTEDGSFMTVNDYNEAAAEDAKIEIKAPVTDASYAVVSYQKFKNMDRKVPAYRTFNGKTLQPGDSVKFVTERKDEVVFYEKFAEAFKGEVEVTFEPAPVVAE